MNSDRIRPVGPITLSDSNDKKHEWRQTSNGRSEPDPWLRKTIVVRVVTVFFCTFGVAVGVVVVVVVVVVV